MIILNIVIKRRCKEMIHPVVEHRQEIKLLYLCRAIFHVTVVKGISLPFFATLSWKTG